MWLIPGGSLHDLIVDWRTMAILMIEGLAWVFSSQERKPVYGLSLVLLVWTNGTLRIPLSRRLWHKGGPQSMSWP